MRTIYASFTYQQDPTGWHTPAQPQQPTPGTALPDPWAGTCAAVSPSPHVAASAAQTRPTILGGRGWDGW